MSRYRSVDALAHLIGSLEAVERAFHIPGASPERPRVNGEAALSDGLIDRPDLPPLRPERPGAGREQP